MQKQLIDFSKIDKLIVKIVDSDLKVVGTQSSDTYIAYESDQPHLEYNGDTLTISTKERQFSFLGPVVFGPRGSKEALEIVVPHGLEELTVSGVSSDILMRSITGRNLVVRTISGDIVLDNVEFTDWQIKTVSGDIRMDSPVAAKLVFSSVSGDLKIKNLTCRESEWIASTTSGDIFIETVGIPSIRLTMRTASGEVNANVGYTREGRDYLFGDGRMKITVSTASGDVDIKSTNRAERSEGIEKKILRLVASGKLTYEQAKQILDELS
ncbi:MAG TPA: DUF4097 family beta strand repeat-containing protein [Pseudothermotoga sp.]|nr:DUF4097 family beta strand repeat-containing protein [Pseudothermotoga sp.]HOK84603.1 DUF4097 family beta strand repeat-containing protein [Pseudothermotoga sp.]HPP69228.1 DUF4097 family beta strand repeat-containing protein [Pseudothermotoga sp.]